MKTKLIKCGLCKREIPSETCELAAYQTVVNGEKHTFCCEACARTYQKKSSEQHAKTKQSTNL
ncbi:MAG: hypothetical protein JSV58_05170 [Candidatus Bathyarchaeota archaeon]|nr:MAG: hypothetical protein JSV58_05170 [Candidatus Bathyarchaeota archaeon]